MIDASTGLKMASALSYYYRNLSRASLTFTSLRWLMHHLACCTFIFIVSFFIFYFFCTEPCCFFHVQPSLSRGRDLALKDIQPIMFHGYFYITQLGYLGLWDRLYSISSLRPPAQVVVGQAIQWYGVLISITTPYSDLVYKMHVAADAFHPLSCSLSLVALVGLLLPGL